MIACNIRVQALVTSGLGLRVKEGFWREVIIPRNRVRFNLDARWFALSVLDRHERGNPTKDFADLGTTCNDAEKPTACKRRYISSVSRRPTAALNWNNPHHHKLSLEIPLHLPQARGSFELKDAVGMLRLQAGPERVSGSSFGWTSPPPLPSRHRRQHVIGPL